MWAGRGCSQHQRGLFTVPRRYARHLSGPFTAPGTIHLPPVFLLVLPIECDSPRPFSALWVAIHGPVGSHLSSTPAAHPPQTPVPSSTLPPPHLYQLRRVAIPVTPILPPPPPPFTSYPLPPPADLPPLTPCISSAWWIWPAPSAPRRRARRVPASASQSPSTGACSPWATSSPPSPPRPTGTKRKGRRTTLT